MPQLAWHARRQPTSRRCPEGAPQPSTAPRTTLTATAPANTPTTVRFWLAHPAACLSRLTVAAARSPAPDAPPPVQRRRRASIGRSKRRTGLAEAPLPRMLRRRGGEHVLCTAWTRRPTVKAEVVVGQLAAQERASARPVCKVRGDAAQERRSVRQGRPKVRRPSAMRCADMRRRSAMKACNKLTAGSYLSGQCPPPSDVR